MAPEYRWVLNPDIGMQPSMVDVPRLAPGPSVSLEILEEVLEDRKAGLPADKKPN